MNYATNVFFHPLIPPFPENNFVKVLQIKRAMTTTQNHHYYEINKRQKQYHVSTAVYLFKCCITDWQANKYLRMRNSPHKEEFH